MNARVDWLQGSRQTGPQVILMKEAIKLKIICIILIIFICKIISSLLTSLEGPFDRNGILSILISIDSILILCCNSISSLKAEQTYKSSSLIFVICCTPPHFLGQQKYAKKLQNSQQNSLNYDLHN